MKPLYIIVHESEVECESDFGIASSVKAYREIQRIKQEHEYRNIDGDPDIIPSDLPHPDKCSIHICGSSMAVCIPRQIRALERAGYKTHLSHSASIF